MNRNIVIPAISAFIAATAGVFATHSLLAQTDAPLCIEGKCPSAAYEGFYQASPWGRYTLTVPKSQRYTSSQLDQKRVEYLCGDMDGCEVRLGMYDWDNQGRVASRAFQLYYNKDSGAWRTSYDNPTHETGIHDRWGTDRDGTTQHLGYAWTCFLTDGEYSNRADSDRKQGLNLLQWDVDGYNADCWVTIID